MPDARLQRYTRFFEQMTVGGLGQLADVMTEDVHFVDPFNDVVGLEKVEAIFLHMFRNLEKIQFTVTHAATIDDSETVGLISWELNSELRGRPYRIEGMSEISFASDGRVRRHIDHWDAARQFYERLPIIGWLLRMIRRRLAV
jgi:steroid delta-isomerase